MVFGVALEVFGQLPDPAREQRDLHIGAACVLFVELELLHVHRVTAFCHKRAGIVGEESVLASSRFLLVIMIALMILTATLLPPKGQDHDQEQNKKSTVSPGFAE